MMTLIEAVGPFYDRWLRLQNLSMQLEQDENPRHAWLKRRLPDVDGFEKRYEERFNEVEKRGPVRRFVGQLWLDAKSYVPAYLMHKKTNIIADLYGKQLRLEGIVARRRASR